MIPLSLAIRAGAERAPQECATGYFMGAAADVFGTAVLGQLSGAAVAPYRARMQAASRESMCQHLLGELHRLWPDLGRSVRAWPKLAEELEQDRLIPKLRAHQLAYRQDIHVSLWKVIADMSAAGESRFTIAAFLARHGL